MDRIPLEIQKKNQRAFRTKERMPQRAVMAHAREIAEIYKNQICVQLSANFHLKGVRSTLSVNANNDLTLRVLCPVGIRFSMLARKMDLSWTRESLDEIRRNGWIAPPEPTIFVVKNGKDLVPLF